MQKQLQKEEEEEEEKAHFTNVYLEYFSSYKTERSIHQQLFQEELWWTSQLSYLC